MKLSDNADLVRVKHMRDAAEEALRFIENLSRTDLEKNRMLTLALLKELELIGEAASKLSPKFRIKHSEIPWDLIVATRNRLIHGYFDVDLEIVWTTVSADLPQLVRQLKSIIPSTE